MADYDDTTPSEESAEEPTLDESLPRPVEENINGTSPVSPETTDEIEAHEVMTTRAYQQEMLDESLKRNIIVAVCAIQGLLS